MSYKATVVISNTHRPYNPLGCDKLRVEWFPSSTFVSCCQTNSSIIHCHYNSDSRVIRYCNDGLVRDSEKMKPSAFHFPEGLKSTLFSFPVYVRLSNLSSHLNFPTEFCQNDKMQTECNWCL